jgi:hypothetical protein
MKMGKCFVIQPFDEGKKYDKRYSDIFKPIIQKCGLVAYRVDMDAGSQIPIDDIDYQIRMSDLCLAEITENNPNVWFEIGLAIAYKKEIIFVCSKEREGKYPFDIQHRTIISYESESVSDFDKLKDKLEDKINALKTKITQSSIILENANIVSGDLQKNEIAVLVSIASNIDNPDSNVAYHIIQQDVMSKNYTKLGILLGIKKLNSLEYIDYEMEGGYNNEYYTVYKITEKGMNWLIANSGRLELVTSSVDNSRNADDKIDVSNDIPF